MIYRVETFLKDREYPYRVYLIKTEGRNLPLEEHYREIFGDPVVERVFMGKKGRGVEVHYLPGVMDPSEQSIKRILKEFGIEVLRIKTGTGYPSEEEAEENYNPLIQFLLHGEEDERVFIEDETVDLNDTEIELLEMDKEELMELSRKYLLALNMDEMLSIQNYYRKKGRNPTKIEIETIAQTWSEHCKHKTFNSRFIYRGKEFSSLLKDTIFKATEEIDHPFCLSVFKDNSGVIEFDENYGISFKVETHNHPSALEPYGGASTGIGGVIRDCLGTGRGAKPIMNTDFFVTTDTRGKGIDPVWFLKGVVEGVRDYGNRMGIPTLAGGVYFHPGYSYNPLVYAGTLGIIRKNRIDKWVEKGDIILLVGARTGKDGIHGATFSSRELNEDIKTYSGVVQIGNPVEEKKLMEAILKASHEDLFHLITDCGGGGLSSAIGENVDGFGAEVYLDRVPLKYKGLKPDEIWISESQERMVIFAPQKNVSRIKEIFKKEEVEVSEIGVVTDTGKIILKYKERIVGELDLEFLHRGLPKRTIELDEYTPIEKKLKKRIDEDFNSLLLSLISHPIVASKEWIIRQYDHEVQARSVLKPIAENRGFVNNDGVVIIPVRGKNRGIAVSHGFNPLYGFLSPYRMALSAIDETIRNLVCTGVNPEKIALLDNFCWGDVEDKNLLAALVEASMGCYEGSKGFGVPFISGKDSLNNYSLVDNEKISIPSTLLISGIGIVEDLSHIRSSDFKGEVNPIFLIGETRKEMGGSLLYHIHGGNSGVVPSLHIDEAKKIYRKVYEAIKKDVVYSLHDLSEGGLGVAVAEMCIGGSIGAKLEISAMNIEPIYALFSESNSRILVEVKDEEEFIKIMEGVPIYKLGTTGGEKLRIHAEGKELVNISVEKLTSLFRKTIPEFMERR